MKKQLLILCLFISTFIRAQGDACAGATVLAINGTCVTSVSNITGAHTASGTAPLPFCYPVNDKDIWYKFTGTGGLVTIKYQPVAGRNAVLAVYTGACGGLTQIDCGDLNGNAAAEVSIIENTNIATTYFIRIMRNGGGNMNGTICAWGGVETLGNDCFTPSIINSSNSLLYSSTLSTPTGQAIYDPSTTQFNCNGSIDNLTYFKVTTNGVGGTITYSVDELNCWQNTGIQIGLFLPTTACSSAALWNTNIFCNLIAANTTTVVNWTGLLANKTYYLIIDGFGGDLCSWRISFAGVLPINLISFTGEVYTDYNLLKWITASEINNHYFTLERSYDGISFNEVERVDGAGTSIINLSYSAMDMYQYNHIIYYRLTQTDFDGKYTSSEIIAVTRTNNDKELKVIKIYNLLGQEVSDDTEGIKVYYFNDGSVMKKYKVINK